MTMEQDAARAEILIHLRMAVQRGTHAPAPVVPAAARFAARVPGSLAEELAALLREIELLGGHVAQPGSDGLGAALAGLVQAEQIRRAVLWDTAELRELNVAGLLAGLGVTVVPSSADKYALAECDLGVTGVDYALPETGTLVLRSSAEKPRLVSLLPRVHLALLHPAALRPDLHQVFAEVEHDPYVVFVSGPSRTSDIELTLTIGVHGPKALYAWVLP